MVEHEGRRSAAEQKAADQTAAAKHALSLQQKEWERAETLAKSNRELERTDRALELELATARAEAVAARQTQDIAGGPTRTAQGAAVAAQARTEQVEALRAELAAAGEQTGAVHAEAALRAGARGGRT